MQDKIAISLLKIFLFNINNPKTPREETNQLIACLISTVYLMFIKLSKNTSNE